MRKRLLSLAFLCLALAPAFGQRSGPWNLNSVGTSGVNSCAVIQVPAANASTVVINVSGTSVLTLQPKIQV
jgi:hypothetical protein